MVTRDLEDSPAAGVNNSGPCERRPMAPTATFSSGLGSPHQVSGRTPGNPVPVPGSETARNVTYFEGSLCAAIS
jgi:hypothetical protein